MADIKKLNVNGSDYDLKDLYSRTELETINQILLTLASKDNLGEMEDEVSENIESLKTTFVSIDSDTKKTIDAILAELNDPSSEMKSYLDELVLRLQGLDGATVIEYLESEIDRITEALEAMAADSTVVSEEDDRTIKEAIDSIEESKTTLEDLIQQVGDKIDDAGSIQIKDTKSIHTVEDKTWIITPEVELFTVYDINKVNISKIALISPLDNETEIGEGESIRITGDDTKVKYKLLIEGENLHMVDVKATNVENGVSRAISLTNRQDISISKITYDVEFEVSPVMPPDDVISNISISFVMKEEFKDNKFEDESSTELNLGVYSENASYVSSIALSGTGISGSGSSYTASVTDSLKIMGTLTINGNNLVASKFTKNNIKVSNVASGITITVGDITYTSAQKVTAPITITATSYVSSKAGTITVEFVNSSDSFVVTSGFVEGFPNIRSVNFCDIDGKIIGQSTASIATCTFTTSSRTIGTNITNRQSFDFRIEPFGEYSNKLTSASIVNLSDEDKEIFSISGILMDVGKPYITVQVFSPKVGITKSMLPIQFYYNSTFVKRVVVTIEWGEENDVVNGQEFVDLGLSVKWATCNIGASKPEEYGLYFRWGNTVGYTKEQIRNGDFSSDDNYVKAGELRDLTSEEDAAHVKISGICRMPTKDEIQELIDNTTPGDGTNEYGWITNYKGTGINGCLRKSSNGKEIFFPAAGYGYAYLFEEEGSHGYIWSSSHSNTNYADCLGIYSSHFGWYNTYRYYGRNIRAVLPK